MIHIDLFSGIGCFAYAARQVWPDHRVACFGEIDPFCRRILGKHFPGVPIVEDVNDLESIVAHAKSLGWRDGATSNERKAQGKVHTPGHDLGLCDILTGGPPCQPASAAGLRRGQEDIRWLWPQTIAVIAALKPRWILLENPTGLTSLAEPIRKPQVESKVLRRGKVEDRYEAVLTQQEALLLGSIIKDLKDLGYQFPEACDGTPILPVVPACAVGAPHRRDRVWIIASLHPEVGSLRAGLCETEPGRERRGRPGDTDCDAQNPKSQRCGSRGTESARQQRGAGTDGSDSDAADAERIHGDVGGHGTGAICGERGQAAEVQGCHVADSNKSRSQIREMQPGDSREKRSAVIGNPWNEHWHEAATRLCGMDDGSSGGLYRTARLKALGNAIVWQVAAQIMRAIKEVDK